MKKLFLFGLISTTVLTLPAFALEETIGTNARKNLDIVIYNGNRALVKDTRIVPVRMKLLFRKFPTKSSRQAFC